ncbi:DUF6188 family protein [Streptomyces sp. NPDC087901]|uniref:DUF6188 family protein n=1 Tax=Streptomyces sp. NPDC087901 TaxID=3365818 RepID=UPI00381F6EFF
MENGIERVQDGWDVRSMRGVGVGEVIIGSMLALHIGSNGIEVWGPAELTADGETFPVHAATRINLGRVPKLLDQVVAEVHAADSGVLRVRFAHGWRLDVPAAPRGLGWFVALRGSCFLRSTPGGGVKFSDRVPSGRPGA